MGPTEFTKAVVETIKKIPRGKVATYKQIAELVGRPNAVRGVVWILHSSSRKFLAGSILSRQARPRRAVRILSRSSSAASSPSDSSPTLAQTGNPSSKSESCQTPELRKDRSEETGQSTNRRGIYRPLTLEPLECKGLDQKAANPELVSHRNTLLVLRASLRAARRAASQSADSRTDS